MLFANIEMFIAINKFVSDLFIAINKFYKFKSGENALLTGNWLQYALCLKVGGLQAVPKGLCHW